MINNRTQHGLTLVEVMVGITLSLLLLFGMTNLLLENRDTYTTQTSLQRYQEDVRTANIILGRAIRNAGSYGYRMSHNGTNFVDVDGTTFISDKTISNIAKEMVDTEGLMFDGNPIISSPATNNGTSGTLPHSITVRYKSRGGMRDCLGGLVGTTTAVSACTVANTFAVDTINNQLTCSVTSTCGTAQAAQPLINNIQSMAIRYGVDVDGNGSADQYVWPSEVTDWSTVVSVQVALLAVSSADVKPVAASTRYFDGIGIDAGAGVISAADRLVRREYSIFAPVNRRLHNDD